MAFTIPSIFTVIDKLSGPVRAMERNVSSFAGRAEAGIARSERAFRKWTPGLSDAGKQFLSFASTAAIVAGIMGGITFSYQSIKEYDKSMQSLSAVTGLSGKKFEAFQDKVNTVAKDTGASSIDVAKSFELIGSANSKLLESAEAMGFVSKAAITLSQASGDDLASSASSLVGVMNQFNLQADQADRTMNVLAAGAKVGAATIPQVAEAMKNFGSVASSANLSVEESVALVEVLSQKSVFGAEAGTKLRGSLLKLQAAGLGYASGQFNMNDAMEEANRKLEKMSTAKQKDAYITKLFGAENVSTGKILLSNIGQFKEFTNGVTKTSTAVEMANTNNSSLSNILDRLKNRWINMITGSSKTTKGINILKDSVKLLTDNLETVVTLVALAVGFFVVWKALLIASQAAMIGYNIVLGVSNAIQKKSLFYTQGNIYAKNADLVATKAVTAAQWLWNAAMTANPIGLIIVAVAALIALVIVAIDNWNTWGAALAMFLGPIGIIVSVVQAFRRNWEMITKAFQDGGILAGLMAIGKTLLDVVLLPLQQILELVAKFTGADWATKAAESVAGFRQGLGVQTAMTANGGAATVESKPMVNTEKSRQEALVQRMENTNNSRVDINVNDPTGRTETKGQGSNLKIKTSSTLGFSG